MKAMIKTIGAVALAVGVYYLMEVLFNALFRLALNGVYSMEDRMDMLIVANLILKLVVLAVFGFWYWMREKKRHYHPDYRECLSFKNVSCLVGIGLLGQYVLVFMLGFIKMVFPQAFLEYERIAQVLQPAGRYPFVVLLMVVIAGPIAEELLFRGVIYGRLRRHLTITQAAVISAALFGIYHKNMIQGTYAAVFGVILAYVFEKTRTIWGSVLVHVMFNLSSYLMRVLVALLLRAGAWIPGIFYLVFYAGCLTVVVLCLCRLRRFPNRYDAPEWRRIKDEGI